MKKLLILLMATLGMSLAAYADCGGCKKEKTCKDAAACEVKLKEAFTKFDADKDGKLSYDEFKALAVSFKKKGCGSKCEKPKCTKCEGDCKCDKAPKCEKCEGDCKCEKPKCTKCEGDSKCKK